jgi:TrmH family RNA methyltransferase
MLSKSRTKFILSLQKKKVRDDEKLFVIEGDKIVKEFLMAKVHIKTLVAKPEYISSLPDRIKKNIGEIEPASYEDLKKISTLKTPHNAIAVVDMIEKSMDQEDLFAGLSIALDSIQDPGNMGTIIRAASWFGIKYIVCSEECVDVYNPKVIQATMGAILNVTVYYIDLKNFLEEAIVRLIPVYGTFLEGESVYKNKLGKRGIIILGNESKGISGELLPYIKEKIMIPKFTDALYGVESLNVGMAASVILSEFARRRT